MTRWLIIWMVWFIMPMTATAQAMSSTDVWNKIDQLMEQLKQCDHVTLSLGRVPGYKDTRWLAYHHIDCHPTGRLATFTSYDHEQIQQRDALLAVLYNWLKDQPGFEEVPTNPDWAKSKYEANFIRKN